jgi:hypothetical protein
MRGTSEPIKLRCMGMDGNDIRRARRGRRSRILIFIAIATAVFTLAACNPTVPGSGSGTPVNPPPAEASCGTGPVPANCDSGSTHLLRYGTLKRLDLGGGRIDPGQLAVSALAAQARDKAIQYAITYLGNQILPNIVPIVGWMYTLARLGETIVNVIKQVEGGTPIHVQRFAGKCADVPEVFSSIRATHSAFSMSTDLLWNAAVSASTQYIRDYYRKYLGNTNVSCNDLRGQLTSFPMLKDHGHWATAQAKGFTKNLTCDMKTAGHAESQAIERATGTLKTTLRTYCNLVTNPATAAQMDAAYANVDRLTDRCDRSALGAARNVTLHETEVSAINVGPALDDLKLNLGQVTGVRDPELNKDKVGRVVYPETMVAFYNSIVSKGLSQTDANAVNVACYAAGPFVQQVGNAQQDMINEADRVMRDFADMESLGFDHMGEDIIQQVQNLTADRMLQPYKKTNFVELLNAVSAGANCGTGDLYRPLAGGGQEKADVLTHCEEPQVGWGLVRQIFQQLLGGGQSDPAGPLPACSAPTQAGWIKAGECLHVGQTITSPDQRYRLQLQTDGNLVLYYIWNGAARAVWASGTTGFVFTPNVCMKGVPTNDHPEQFTQCIQTAPLTPSGDWQLRGPDNLGTIINTYDPSYSGAGYKVWDSNRYRYTGVYDFSKADHIQLQNDGNLVMLSTTGAVMWASGTNEYAPTGTVQGYVELGNNPGTIVAPEAANTKVSIDGVQAPYGAGNKYAKTLPEGRHVIQVTPPAGWDATTTVCETSDDCHLVGGTATWGGASVVDVHAGKTTNFWFHLKPKASTVSCKLDGSSASVKHVASNKLFSVPWTSTGVTELRSYWTSNGSWGGNSYTPIRLAPVGSTTYLGSGTIGPSGQWGNGTTSGIWKSPTDPGSQVSLVGTTGTGSSAKAALCTLAIVTP